ncbi:MAG: GHKL domain-containing protein [Candidatus Delongbacteria bacterium]|nr:GHKL domain-containing protein [Candidatus Delongbacteria bacterium]
MTRFSRISLKLRLSVIFGILYSILLVLSFSYIYLTNKNEKHIRFQESNIAFSSQSSLHMVNLFSANYVNAFATLKSEIQSRVFDLNRDLERVEITDTSGIIAFSTEEFNDGKYRGSRRIVQDETILNAMRAKKIFSTIQSGRPSKQIMAVLIPYYDFFNRHTANIIFYYSFQSLEREIKAMLHQILYLSALAFIIGFTAAYFLINRNIIHPLEALVDKIRNISTRDYKLSDEEIKALIGYGDEIIAISRWIENNTKQLQDQVEQRTSELAEKNANLSRTTEELKKAQEELVESAHQAGKAELASSVLHNIGNVITSINVRLSLLSREDTMPNVTKLQKILQLIKDKRGQLDRFLQEDPKGEKFIQYFESYISFMEQQSHEFSNHMNYLLGRISLITDILNTQQRYAGMNVIEQVDLAQLIRDSVSIFKDKIDRLGIELVENYDLKMPMLKLERIKLHQVLVNVGKNAIEAIQMGDGNHKRVYISTQVRENSAMIQVRDTGCGISKEDLDHMFTWGFTTKQGENSGHGFGLHSCANAVNSMGGTIQAESEGRGLGATITIVIPQDQPQSKKPHHDPIISHKSDSLM